MTVSFEVLDVPAAQLGEGICWDPVTALVRWVDIRADTLWTFAPGTGQWQRFDAPATVAGLTIDGDGALICSARRGPARWRPEIEDSFVYLGEPEPDRPGNRFNDSTGDRNGRFWLGSMNDDGEQPTGALYRLDPDGRCTLMVDGLTMPNSLACSPSGDALYFADTLTRRIVVYPLDPASGELGAARTFAVVEGPGHPDGSTVDADGCLWNAEWDGWRLVRYRPDGTVDRVVELPVQRPTKCAFGGPDLRTLFVTTAAADPSDRGGLDGRPLAGRVLALDVGVGGLADTPFGG